MIQMCEGFFFAEMRRAMEESQLEDDDDVDDKSVSSHSWGADSRSSSSYDESEGDTLDQDGADARSGPRRPAPNKPPRRERQLPTYENWTPVGKKDSTTEESNPLSRTVSFQDAHGSDYSTRSNQSKS